MTDRPRIWVVGLGPAGPGMVTADAAAAIAAHPPECRWARTGRHPAVSALGEHRTFDAVYEASGTLDEVYATIVDRLVASANAAGSLLYAVPGSPAVAERTVELLRARSEIDLRVVPAVSFLDLAWSRLGVDPLHDGVRLVDGHRFAVEAAGERAPLLVAQCDSRDVLSAVKLSVEEPPTQPVTVLQRLGLPDESVTAVPWDDLDRSVAPDHLTTLWIPELAAPVGSELVRFEELVRILRERCPWDRQQTHASLRPYVVEEAYEVVEAIDRLVEAGGEATDRVDELAEELGDLLFQVYFHATIAAGEGWFTLADVARGIHDKLVRRHPHVFGDVDASDAGSVVRNWEEIKRSEKGGSAFDRIPAAFPARLYAAKVASKAAKLGVDADFSAEEATLEQAELALRAAARRVAAAARRLEPHS